MLCEKHTNNPDQVGAMSCDECICDDCNEPLHNCLCDEDVCVHCEGSGKVRANYRNSEGNMFFIKKIVFVFRKWVQFVEGKKNECIKI